MTNDFPALAVIDGTLCQLTRSGAKGRGHAPIATAVAEFRLVPFRCYVREQTYGLLPGMPNLYCLDAAFRLQWLAEWPDPADPCAAIVGEENGVLVTRSTRGLTVHLDAHTGRLRTVEAALAAAG